MDGSAGLNLKSAQAARWDLVSLGEVMLRFDPGEQRIAHTREFRVWKAAASTTSHAACAVASACEHRSSPALADNPVGRLIEDLMLQGGVDLSHLRWVPYDGIGRAARNGIYFLERGHGVRGALGMMDRGHTPISQLRAGEVDWDAIFATEARAGSIPVASCARYRRSLPHLCARRWKRPSATV